MRFVTRLGNRVTRRIVMAFLTGAVLPRPTPGAAQSDGSCQHSAESDTIIYVLDISGSAGVALRLRIMIAPDGSAEMDGAILVVSALDGSMPSDGSGRPLRLVARGTPAQISCADGNSNGRSGLIRLAADLEDSRSGARIPVSLETLPEHDIDASGIYDVSLQIGETLLRRPMRVRIGSGRRQRRRRHRR